MIAEFYPSRVVAYQLDNALNQPHAPGVGVRFSGGVDAFIVIADYFFNLPPGFHLFYHNVGAHDWLGRQPDHVSRPV